jgi:hypothetical protein
MADVGGDIVSKATGPISNNPMYLVKGAIGGYVGGYAMAKYYKYDNIEPLGRYQIESGIAGLLGVYIWMLIMGDSVDVDSMWKGVAVGAVAEMIYNKWIKQYVSGIYE